MSHSRLTSACTALAALLLSACTSGEPPAPAASESTIAETPAPSPTDTAADDPFVPDAAEDEPGFPTSFRALGTEPFWALHVSDGRMRYTTPEDQEGKSVPYTREETGPGQVSLTATLDGQSLVLSGQIAPCSDGMSDREYPFTVELKIGAEIRHGCGRPIEP